MENHITDTGGLITDASVILAMSFLDKIGAPKLRKQLETLAEEGKLVLTEGPALVSGGIGVDSTEDVPTRAWSVLRRLLTLAGDGISDEDTAAFESAFGKFRADGKNFDLDSADPGLTLTVLSMENALKSASNEGGITFLPEAYTHMVDVSDISMEDCEKEGIVEDIKSVFRRTISEHQTKSYVMSQVENSEVLPGDMLPRHILVRRLSNGILPTVKEFENGTVVINENFVRLMYKFKKTNLGHLSESPSDKSRGNIFTLKDNWELSAYAGREGAASWKDRCTMGNFYESLLFLAPLENLWVNMKLYPDFSTDQSNVTYCFKQNQCIYCMQYSNTKI